MKTLLLFLLAAAPLAAQPLKLKATLQENPIVPGTSPIFKLNLQNTSKTPVTFEYFSPTFWYPQLEDTRGKKYLAQFPPYDGPAQKVTLTIKPGQVQVLQSNACLFTSQPGKPEQAFIQLPPGRYKVSFQVGKLKSVPLTVQVNQSGAK
jgi:hypothetical protein